MHDDVWFIIDNNVYDVTNFLAEHPGGEEVLLDLGGEDATEAFEDVGHSDEARDLLKPLLIGALKNDGKKTKRDVASVDVASAKSDSPMMSIVAIVVAVLALVAYKLLA